MLRPSPCAIRAMARRAARGGCAWSLMAPAGLLLEVRASAFGQQDCAIRSLLGGSALPVRGWSQRSFGSRHAGIVGQAAGH